MTERKHGDFTGLATDYEKHRPDYSPAVLDAIEGLLRKDAASTDVVDVGAGTGIWARMLAVRGFRSLIAIEPNDDMRSAGQRNPDNGDIQWRAGSGEETHLPDGSADLISMASSFHWVDFERGIAEFSRVLRKAGLFVALWNPRYIQDNPLLVEIEDHLSTLTQDRKRVSSGRSGITETLTERLQARREFADVTYLEGRHTIAFTPERYLGVWRSVNDVQVQLGPEGFAEFLRYVERKVANLETIPATYLTRAWVARKT